MITLYNPDSVVIDNVREIAKQVKYVYLYDNSEVSNYIMFSDIDNIEYYSEKKNNGISKAYNTLLCKSCLEFRDNDFIIFFDQDSKICEGYIKALVEEYEQLESRDLAIGCLGPIFYNTSNDMLEVPKVKKTISKYSYQVDNIITSSLLTRYKNLAEINYWNEDIFLDFTDWDLCWRMIKNQKICAITSKVVLNHSVGIGNKKIVFFSIRIGHPVREYYQIRDALYLVRKNYVPLKMRIKLLQFIFWLPLIHCIFLDEKEERRCYVKRAYEDYRKKIRGCLR